MKVDSQKDVKKNSEKSIVKDKIESEKNPPKVPLKWDWEDSGVEIGF